MTSKGRQLDAEKNTYQPREGERDGLDRAASARDAARPRSVIASYLAAVLFRYSGVVSRGASGHSVGTRSSCGPPASRACRGIEARRASPCGPSVWGVWGPSRGPHVFKSPAGRSGRTQRPPFTTARNDEFAPWCLSGRSSPRAVEDVAVTADGLQPFDEGVSVRSAPAFSSPQRREVGGRRAVDGADVRVVLSVPCSDRTRPARPGRRCRCTACRSGPSRTGPP